MIADIAVVSKDIRLTTIPPAPFTVRGASTGDFVYIRYSPESISIRMTFQAKTGGTPVKASTDQSRQMSGFQALPPATALKLQARLRSRWPQVMARARELQKITPNPIQSMIDLLGGLPGDYATWREILEEPYG